MIARLSRYRLLALLCGVFAVFIHAAPAAATIEDPSISTDRIKAAAGWLSRQLVDGERFETVFDGVAYPDQGLTLDAVFSFAAAQVADESGARALAWVSRPDIRDGHLGDGTTEAYAGATAKLALAVQVRGGQSFAILALNRTPARATAQAVLGMSGSGYAQLSATGSEPDAPVLDFQ